MKVEILKEGQVICRDVLIADTLVTRLIGLMFKRKLTGAAGLLISPCNSIHTFFMCYSLDVVFLDGSHTVVKIIRGLKPWRMTWIYFRARQTLELPAGNLSGELKVGDVLEVRNV
ncbi:MAG TPA: DUF192 domain-containing protein [Bacteriovoracaceae bacterium]|nr:DUF192 domain-containing protein [Bacteriovoracaceae bacterium]